MKDKNKVALRALKFIGTITLVAVVTYLLLQYSPAQGLLAWLTAESSRLALSALGINSTIVWQANPHLVSQNFDAELIPLCQGTLELALWVAVVVASDNKSLPLRIKGLFAGLALFLLFNPFRIAVTLRLFDPVQPFTSLVAHDVLFRTSLLALFVTAYAVFQVWPEEKSTAPAKKRSNHS